MKRMFVLAAAACLGACASPPPAAVTANHSVGLAQTAAPAVAAQPAKTTERVYLDDRDLIHVKAPPLNRRVLVLGAGKDAN
jgi:uncharacterized lipoprotein YmbA